MLADGELEEWELKGTLQSLAQDAEMQACWRNYHLIGDAMRGHLPSPLCLDLSERVSQALKHEPAYFPPRHHAPTTSAASQNRTKTAVGFALAASLSAIAVVGVMQIGQPETRGIPASVATASTAAPTSAVPVATEDAQPRFMYTFTADASAMPRTVPPAGASVLPVTASAGLDAPRVRTVAVSQHHGLPLANDLTDYLMNYQRYAATHDKEDTLSYLRLVGYGE